MACKKRFLQSNCAFHIEGGSLKHRNNRLFWTALGATLLGEQQNCDVTELPSEMQEALKKPLSIPGGSCIHRGQDLEGKRGRHIYMLAWKTLRDAGFSRPFRSEVFPGVELFLPFVKDNVVVLPQGFQKRIPLKLRALALVGKNAVLRTKNMNLVIVAAVYDETTWTILERGGCSVCTVDKLPDALQALDLS